MNADVTEVLLLPYYHTGQYNLFAYCNNNPTNDYDDDGQLSWLAKIAIGVTAIGVGVTALTGGAALPALVAGAISAGTSAAMTAVNSSISGDDFSTAVKKSVKAAVDGFADGFMVGGIMAGSSQVLSGGFKVAANLGVKTGRNGGVSISSKVKILSPNHKNFYENGGTILKIGSKSKNIRLDVGSQSLFHINVQFSKNIHVPVGTMVSGIYGGFR